MNRIVLLSLHMLLLVSVLVSAQPSGIKHMAPSILDESTASQNNNYTPYNSPLDGNYIPVDTMTNAYSFSQSGMTPIYFDPYSGVLTIVHRGWEGYYAASSGQIWYNISTDYGITWKRVPNGINTNISQQSGRYPNMTIANPTKGNISSTIAFFAWPELNGPNFSFLGYAIDHPAGKGSPSAYLNSKGGFSSRTMVWSDDVSPIYFWTNTFTTSAALEVFRTTDFSTIFTIAPPQWSDTVFQKIGNIGIGACAYNGNQYVGVIAPFSQSLDPNPPLGNWLVGYSKSTNKGFNWTNFKMADWRQILRLSNYQTLFDYKKNDTLISYQGNIGVDKNNHVHIIVSVTDTSANNGHGINSIIDIFETNSGWDGTVVYSGLDTAYSNGPGAGQIGPSAELAFDSTHSVMAVQFINTPAPGKPNDVFITYKGIYDTVWSVPVNLTNSGNVNNTAAHLAPYLYKSGTNQYTAFSAYCYSTAPFTPDYDGLSTAVLYAEPYTFTYGTTGINNPPASVSDFNLLQNFPNPFNPSTKITYNLPYKANVKLEVFNIIGEKIVQLVNAEQSAGTHSVDFNSSLINKNLPSGIYIYRIVANNNSDGNSFVDTKKMILLK
ncbi:MAG: T9SS type A sorting domain-containing protein [Ignavibacteriaceae bacterium]|nr:T9SS type A sorting domain-containing protein [Ignavibacteriaceae bacterium]